MTKKLINKPEEHANEALQGLLLAEPRLIKLEHNVIVRSDYQLAKEKHVAVISGGGSGHEPAFAGYVGEGFLSAAVCGGVFASPSAAAVLEAIKAVTGPAGCLVVVMNYTGDRLNFGMAVERAKAEGLKVQLMVVADDCALPRDKGITGRRKKKLGVAGTVLVGKVACAAAQAGGSLEDVHAEALAINSNVGTLGVALTVCSLPGQPENTRIPSDKMEIGLGIHGEAGTEQTSMLTADEAADRMLAAVLDPPNSYLPVETGSSVALLVNNLGATSQLEMLVVLRQAVTNLNERGLHVARIYHGHYMTSLDMTGVSITVARVDALVLARLDAPAFTAGWSGASQPQPARFSSGEGISSVKGAAPAEASAAAATSAVISPGDTIKVRAALNAVCEALSGAEADLTAWDTIAGDGDCGVTFARGAATLKAALAAGKIPLDSLALLLRSVLFAGGSASFLLSYSTESHFLGTGDGIACCVVGPASPTASLSAQCSRDLPLTLRSKLKLPAEPNHTRSLGRVVSESMGGTIGAILEIFFSAGEGAARMGGSWPEAVRAGCDSVMFYGGAEVGMRTVLDALVPFADALVADGLKAAVDAAVQGAEGTRKMEGAAGRSNYVVGLSEQDVPDPGAMAVAVTVKAILSQL
ncbi:unnamed protein product [Chrysoparadoxa australica]